MKRVSSVLLFLLSSAATFVLVKRKGEMMKRNSVYDGEIDSPETTAEGSLLVMDRLAHEMKRWLGIDEKSEAAVAPLLAYWKSAGFADANAVEAYARANGFNTWQDVPWSAAFISYVTRGMLPPSASHVGYLDAVLRNPERLGYRSIPLDSPLVDGDIVINRRDGGEPPRLEPPLAFFPSHGDVFARTSAGQPILIGGNKRNKVTYDFAEHLLNEEGALSEAAREKGYFAVLRIAEEQVIA
jgi:hypothetical protein